MVENGEGKSKFTNLLTKYVFINSFFFLENEADHKTNVFLLAQSTIVRGQDGLEHQSRRIPM